MTKKAKGGRGKGRSIQTEEEKEIEALLSVEPRKQLAGTLADFDVEDREVQDFLDVIVPLTQKEVTFLAAYMKSGNAAQAARASGYENRNPIVRNKKLQAAVTQMRRSVAVRLNYTATTGMQELDKAIVFAQETGNAMAYVRAVETKAKIAGLLQPENQIVLPSLSFNIVGIKQPEYIDAEVVPDGD